jgi:hypothetical protein
MLDDPFSDLYQLRLALLNGASLIVNPRRQVATIVHGDVPSQAIDVDVAQRLVDALADADRDPAADRVTISSKRRTMSIHQYRRERQRIVA